MTAMVALVLTAQMITAQTFQLGTDYFNAGGTDVMAFSDFYPEGHQGGVCVLMNGRRIATNGDIRMEATPGQWQPVPKQLSRKVEHGRITTTLCYPDSSRHLTGFNPMVYPDYHVNYTVTVEAQGSGVLVTVDLDTPVPDFLLGKVGFNLEFFPGELFGKPWVMDDQTGIYPRQPNGPLLQLPTNRGHDGDYFTSHAPSLTPYPTAPKQKADQAQLDGEGYSPLRADDIIAEPYAVGRRFTSRPDDQSQRLTVESLTFVGVKYRSCVMMFSCLPASMKFICCVSSGCRSLAHHACCGPCVALSCRHPDIAGGLSAAAVEACGHRDRQARCQYGKGTAGAYRR